MPSNFKAIKGKKLKLPTRVLPQAQIILQDFQRRGVNEVSKYPVQLPAKDRIDKRTGKRTKRPRYKRTNSLARSWSRESGVTGTGRRLTATVVSSPGTAPYNVQVVGPVFGARGKRQTKEMRRRNWPSAPKELEKIWNERAVPRLERLLTNQR